MSHILQTSLFFGTLFAVSFSKTALAIRCTSFYWTRDYISQNSRTQPEPAIASWPEQSGDHNRTDLVRKASADFFIGGNIVSYQFWINFTGNMNIYKYDITISASGSPVGAPMPGTSPNATTSSMGQPPKPFTSSDTSFAKLNQVNFVKKPLCISKKCVFCHLNRKFDEKRILGWIRVFFKK